MRLREPVALLFVLTVGIVASCAAPPTGSEDDRSLFAGKDPVARDLAEELTYDYLDANDATALYGVDGVSTRVVIFDDQGQAHTRLAQTHDGIPVFGAEAVVHLGPDGTVAGITDDLFHDLRIDTTPLLGATEAQELAVDATGGWARVTEWPLTDLQILRYDRTIHLAWRVQIRQFEAGFDPAMPVVFVDAHDGAIVWHYDNLKHTPLSDADKRAYDMHNGSNYGSATIADSSDLIAKDAYDHSGQTLDYFLAEHGRDSFSGTGTPVYAYVHYGFEYVNAFWDGSVLTFGDGDDVDSGPLTTLDIVAHEFSHGVTDYSSNLIYSGESGALNEATSDIFAAAVENSQGGDFNARWLVGEDTWLYGPDVGQPPMGPALRVMYDPAAVGDYDYYPTRYIGTQDNGGVHWNSGIANLFFFLLSEGGTHPRGKTTNNVTPIGIVNAADVWYLALTAYMTPSTDFAGARAATVTAATVLNPAWVPSVEQAWDAVGVAAPPDYSVVEQYTNRSGTLNSQTAYGPYDASECSAIKFKISGGTGDADLYVKFGSAATLSNWDCRPYSSSNNEKCEANPAQSGNYYAMVHAYSAYAGLTVTVSADCGPPPPAEICDDTVDNDGDTLADCADPDCAAFPACVPPAEVCTDTVDNDGDTLVDCDDPDCDDDPACAPPAEVCDDDQDNDEDGDFDCDDADCEANPACQWAVLSSTNFETGLGPYTDGGADMRRLATSQAHQGSYAAEIRDNSGAASSFYSTNGIDLDSYDEIEIDFWYRAKGVENGEDFYVELWTGSTWQVVARYVRGTHFTNNTYYHPVVTVSAPVGGFSPAAKLRFRADASDDNDLVYIDEIVVSAR